MVHYSSLNIEEEEEEEEEEWGGGGGGGGGEAAATSKCNCYRHIWIKINDWKCKILKEEMYEMHNA